MPWWAILYLVLFVPFAISAVLEDVRAGAHNRAAVVALPALAAVMGTLFYWLTDAPSGTARAAVGVLLLAGVSILAWDTIIDLRKLRASGSESTAGGTALSVAILVLVFMPGYVWGFLFAAGVH